MGFQNAFKDMFFHIVLSDKDSGERFGSVLAEKQMLDPLSNLISLSIASLVLGYLQLRDTWSLCDFALAANATSADQMAT